jgi:two-component system phosphate regulon sensor histidine kinase PhoR
MTETGAERPRRPLGSLIVERLFQGRWTLGAAVVAVLVLNWTVGGPWFAGIVAGVALVFVAALAPRRSSAQREAEEAAATVRPPVEALSAASLAASVPDPLLIFDGSSVLVFANAAAGAAFGTLAPGASLQLKFRTPEMQDLIRRVLEPGSNAIEADYVERVPFERVYKVYAVPVAGGLYVMIFKDQSEARRIDRMRADFIANASHELRTPLASISGFVETLRGPAKNDAKARDSFLLIMQNQTARMARLIDDLLSLSRLETKPYLKPGTLVDLNQIVGSVIDSLSHLAGDSGVAIEQSMPAAPVMVAGDRDELIQVFENLLENAIKYGQSGKKVVVSVEAQGPPGGEASVTVRDFGPGIAEEHIPRITERFYRADVETSRAQKGTGLGLSIVKHIITRHDARLAIRSQPGDGASFTVHFPPA